MTERVELVVVRDPDGGTDIDCYVDGYPVPFTEYMVDAGAGYTRSDWDETTAEYLAQASSELVRGRIDAARDRPPGWQYIDERE